MMKLIVFVFAVIYFVHANPIADNSGYSSGAQGQYNYGNWPQRPQFPQMQWPRIQPPRIITPQEIENMKPGPGGQVNGMSESMSSHTVYENGVPVTKREGTIIRNTNGNVEKKSYGN